MIVPRLVLTLLGLFVASIIDAGGQTLLATKAFGRYQQLVWQDQHGLPQNTVRSIRRTRDGYLWLGTLEGAVRFDGVRFTVFDSGTTKAIGVSLILDLLEDRAGSLWLATDGTGVVRRTPDGAFTRFSTEEGLSDAHVMCLLEDHAGTLWAGTDGGGLDRFEQGRFTTYTRKHGLPSDQIWALAEDTQGALWVGTTSGLARLKDGQIASYTERDGLHGAVRALWPDRQGALWIGTSGGLSRLAAGRFTSYGPKEGLPHDEVRALLEDREGTLWIGTDGNGLLRLRDGHISTHSVRDGLPGNRVAALYQDPEGSVWVGTDGSGLAQLRDGRIRVYTDAEGVADNMVRTVYEDTAGTLWIGTTRGVTHLRAGAFTTYTTDDGLPSNYVRGIAEDPEGNLWFATTAGVARFAAGRFSMWTAREGLSSDNMFSVLGDHDGNVWVGTVGGGLNRLHDRTVTVFTTRDGLADNDVVALFEDRSGSLWVGTRSGGISRLTHGRFTTWSTKDGLPSNHILSFHEDRSGAIWVGTHGGGLIRFKSGTITTITTAQGLYDNLAFQILEDDLGDLWMSGNKGIYRASLKALDDVADGRATRVTSFAYGVADGMLSRECNGGSPGGWKSGDGRLWFATVKGVVLVDPTRRDRKAPLVAIERVMVDQEMRPAGSRVRIAPGQGNLEVAYTGLSWDRPQSIAFKYRLAGLDKDWVDAGTRRTAYYPHLPPGDYAFTVIADNGEGVWNTEGRSLAVSVLPAFYQTWWFLTLGSVALSWVAMAAWRMRVGQLQRAQVAQQAFSRQLIASQERERQRIAAELHDSLGQHLLIIKSRALLGASSLARETAADAHAQFGEIAASAGQSLAEVRQIARNLRPLQLDRLGLTQALGAMIDAVAAASPIQFESRLDSIDRLFSKEAEITIFRIVQESLNNIVKHAHATEATIAIDRQAAAVTISIRDNGKGFDVQPEPSAGSNGGFGLAGMTERVRMLGGAHRVQSARGAGTIITIRLDLPDRPTGDRHVH